MSPRSALAVLALVTWVVAAHAVDTGTLAVPYSATSPTTIGSGIDVDLINQQRFSCLAFVESDLLWLDTNGAQQTTATIELVTSYSSLARTLNLEVDYKSKADVSVAALKGGASVSLNVKYDTFAKDESRSLALVVKAQSDYGRKGVRKYALDAASQALIDAKDYKGFRERCGTHTVVAEHRTAMVATVISLSEVSASGRQSLESMFKSSGSFSGAINVAQVSASSETAITFKRLVESASRLGNMKVTFESRGGLGIPDAVKLAITNDPTKVDVILSKLGDVGASFTKENSAVVEYVVLPNTAFGLKSTIADAEKLDRLNGYYLQLSKVDFALNRIASYDKSLPVMYTQIYVPAVGRLRQTRTQLVTLIENCVLNDDCKFVAPPSIDVLYLEDVIQPDSFELSCFYDRFDSTSGNVKVNVLSNAALVLRGKARLTKYVSVPNAIITRLADTGTGSGSPIFQTFAMSEPDANGTARFLAQVDSVYFRPVAQIAASTVTITNLNEIVEARRKLTTSIYGLEMQAVNGETVLNSVGPAFGGNCPVQKPAQ